MPQFQMIAFDGLRGNQGVSARPRFVPRGGASSRYVLFEPDPSVVTAQQAETQRALWWGTRPIGVFGQASGDLTNRTAGYAICGLALLTVVLIFMATSFLRGRRE